MYDSNTSNFKEMLIFYVAVASVLNAKESMQLLFIHSSEFAINLEGHQMVEHHQQGAASNVLQCVSVQRSTAPPWSPSTRP